MVDVPLCSNTLLGHLGGSDEDVITTNADEGSAGDDSGGKDFDASICVEEKEDDGSISDDSGGDYSDASLSEEEKQCFKSTRKIKQHGTAATGVVLKPALVVAADGFLTGVHGLRSDTDEKIKIIHDMVSAVAGDKDISNEYRSFIALKVQRHVDLYGARPSLERCAFMVKDCYRQMLKSFSRRGNVEAVNNIKSDDGIVILGGCDYGELQLWIANKSGARRAPKYCFAGSGGEYLENYVRGGYKKSNTVSTTTKSIEKGMLASSQHDSESGGVVQIATLEPLCISTSSIRMNDLMHKHDVYFEEIKVHHQYERKLDSERLDIVENENEEERRERLSKLAVELKRTTVKSRKSLPTARFRITPQGDAMMMRSLKWVRLLETVKILQRR